MPCRRKSSVRPASKPAVFTASFQPLGAADKASFQRGKRTKRLYFHNCIQNLCCSEGLMFSFSSVASLRRSSFASRIADELNFLESGPLGSPLQRATFSPPSLFRSYVFVRMRITKTFRDFYFRWSIL